MPEDDRRQGPQTPDEAARMRRVARWLLIGLVWAALITAAVFAWVLQVEISDVPKEQRGWLLLDVPTRLGMRWTGIACTAVAFAGPLFLAFWVKAKATANSRANTEQGNKRLELVIHILSPLVGINARLARTTTDGQVRHKLAGDALRTALVALHTLFGGAASGNARASYFQVEGKVPHRKLIPVDYQGRYRKPRAVITENDDRGSETFRALDAGEARRWSKDDPERPPPGWHERKSYSAFIAYPVAADDHLFGMITVDSPNPCAFRDPMDWETVQLVADLYGAILAILQEPSDE